MASQSPSSRIITSESSTPSRAISINLNAGLSQAPIQESGVLNGPVAILWDIENCPVPSDVRPEDVAGNIRMALRVHPVIKGAVTMFSAFGDFNAFPRRLREGCQRTGVKLVDVPNGRKDAADKAILVDMFLFALDNRPPSSILLISGDVDFAPALHILGQRGYTVILVIPSGVGVSSALSNAGRFVWDWPSVARGEGFVPPKSLVPRGLDISGYLMGCNLGDNPDFQNEEEAIVYRGISQSECNARANYSQIYSANSSHVSRAFYSMSEYSSNNLVAVPGIASSRSHSLPSGLSEVSGEQTASHDETLWVQPGDVQGLKGQLVRLLEMFGGSLPLIRVPAEYQKMFGRPLYMAEYGVYKLVNLIRKMADAMTVEGKGHKKCLCLRNSVNGLVKTCLSTQTPVRKDKKGKTALEENIDVSVCPNMGSSSDEDSDDDRIVACDFDDRLESFRQEVQDLIVCFGYPLPLSSFQVMYERRYKKVLDYQSFGVDGPEELIEKVRDVAVLREEEGSKRKLLFSSCISG